MIEKRKEPRQKFQARVRIGYDFDDLELCGNISCDGGRVVTDVVAENGKFILADCPKCGGRGFKPKGGKVCLSGK